MNEFKDTLEKLDAIGAAKVGDPWPPFLTDGKKDWGEALSALCRIAAFLLRAQAGRTSDLIAFNNQFEERARNAERAMKLLVTPRPIDEYHEDMGDVLWWKFPIEEAPYCGTPNDIGITVEAHTNLMTQLNQSEEPVIARFNVGGWPGYHTHFTPLPDAATINQKGIGK